MLHRTEILKWIESIEGVKDMYKKDRGYKSRRDRTK